MDAPRIADRYEVIRPLGHGSFAQTLLARDDELDRQVAVKVLHPRAAKDWKAYELFDREAAVLRELRHHAVPAVHDSFRAEWEGTEAAFLVMEYVEGASLAQMIAARRHLDREEVLYLFLEMLGVLDYLHTRVPPVLHRDIKPGNIIVRPDGSPALVDFGAVRNVFHTADESGSTVVGTYGYMPYEQLMGQASPASDLYALASTFLHLVTGRAPPDFMTNAGRLEVPPSLPCGEPLRGVLARLLAAAPADRLQSAREARAALLAGVAAPRPGAGASTALAPSAQGTALGQWTGLALELAPVPRPLEGKVRELMQWALYTPGELMDPDEKRGVGWNVADVFMVALGSVFTAGVLPAMFWSRYRSRKKRLKQFFVHGLPAVARVLDMTPEGIGFGSKLTRVRYEFEADGRRLRDSDLVLPSIANRWDVGDYVQILYRPDRDYDSVILGTV